MPFFEGQSRNQLRDMYVATWRKFKAGVALEPLERQIAAVIGEHPEYVPVIESEDALTADFSPESGRMNPFLHLALHLALREQVATDRPAGIARLHRELAARFSDAHEAEHRMLEKLAEVMWEMQRDGRPVDEREYWEKLRKL